jgi:hypothetical protein
MVSFVTSLTLGQVTLSISAFTSLKYFNGFMVGILA